MHTNLPEKPLIDGVNILTTSSTPATSIHRQLTVEADTASIGHLLRTIAAIRTT